MTVSSNTSTTTFLGNGATVFPLPFRFFDNADLRVYRIDTTTGAATLQVLGTDYTLTGAGEPEVSGNATGVLTLSAPLSIGGPNLYIERVMEVEQPTDIVNQGNFFADIHEDAFDRMTMLIQQGIGQSNNAFRAAIGDPLPARTPAVAARRNQFAGFDSDGNLIPLAPPNDSAAGLALILADTVNPSNGAARIGRGGQVVSSIAALRTLVSSSASKHAFVTGYYAQGDGGGGPYYLDAADVISADNGGTIIVAADGGRWKRIGTAVSVKTFGAKGDNVANDTTAIQACFDYCTEFGAVAFFPQGTYVIDNTVTLFEDIGSQEPLGGDTKACILGEGSGLSVIRWTGGNIPALRIHGEVISLQSVKGIGLLGNGTGIGLSLRDLAWFHCEDVMTTGFEYGVYGDNVLSSKFDTLICRGNKFGFRVQRLAGVYASHPNAITFINCDIGLNTEWGALITSPGVVSFFGGAIQGNGIGGVNPEKWGLRVSDAGTEGAAGVNLFGVYFEANVGLADVFIEQNNFSAPHSIFGCGFTRIAGNFTTHCIRVDNSPAVVTRLCMKGNGFLSGPGYTPDAGRRYLNVSNPATGFMLDESGSFYSSSVETHDLAGRHQTIHTSAAVAAEYDGATSTPIRFINVASVTPAGAGLFDVVFSTPLSGNAYVALPSVTAGAGFAFISNRTASGFRVNTLDFSGSPANIRWAVTVFD